MHRTVLALATAALLAPAAHAAAQDTVLPSMHHDWAGSSTWSSTPTSRATGSST